MINGGVKTCQWGGAKEGQYVLRALQRVALKYKSTVYIPKPSRIMKGQKWLADKRLVTQNIDGLDGKAGNAAYVPIHGHLDKVTVHHEQGLDVPLIDAPWEDVAAACDDLDDNARLTPILPDAFKISKKTLTPEPDVSLKPFVLLFDEYYTDLYRMSEAEEWMHNAQRKLDNGGVL